MALVTSECHRRGVQDAGSASLELVIVTPVLLAFVLLVIGFGRVEHGQQQVDEAAAAAARAASLSSSPGQARTDARAEAEATIDNAGVSCSRVGVSINTDAFGPRGSVSVTVTCRASLSDLAVVGLPGHKTLRATSVSPLDEYRQFGGQTP